MDLSRVYIGHWSFVCAKHLSGWLFVGCMVIVVTGTPGVGKTTYARRLAEELERPVLGVSDLCEQEGLSSEWDADNQCFLVDVEALERVLVERAEANEEVIIEGHLSHELPPRFVERCVVLKCSLKELKRRLEARGYSEAKVRENLDCEIFDVCFSEALERGHDPEVVWTSN